jgi:lipopolysaccharide biosynthesis regulator YciM
MDGAYHYREAERHLGLARMAPRPGDIEVLHVAQGGVHATLALADALASIKAQLVERVQPRTEWHCMGCGLDYKSHDGKCPDCWGTATIWTEPGC